MAVSCPTITFRVVDRRRADASLCWSAGGQWLKAARRCRRQMRRDGKLARLTALSCNEARPNGHVRVLPVLWMLSHSRGGPCWLLSNATDELDQVHRLVDHGHLLELLEVRGHRALCDARGRALGLADVRGDMIGLTGARKRRFAAEGPRAPR